MDAAQQIKERLDIADFLRGYLNLIPAGKNLKTNCPFHKEKTPSFMVSPDRQTWHCFGCGIGGDVFAFLMRYENIDFVEALKILGEKTGVDIGRWGNSDQKQYSVLYGINRAAADYFKAALRSGEGKPAVEYLKKRGVKGETAKEFEIGFAPDRNDGLMRHLIGMGFPAADVEKSGLAIKSERGMYFDRFRDRIVFPLYNHFGKVVGFTGRIMPGSENNNIAKYMNSPETPVFNKSRVLYGLHLSKDAIRESQSAVLVEGQMDFIMAWQDGLKNLVATSGTALTAEHLKSLRRFADKLLLFFDADEAGGMATERAIDLAAAADFSTGVISIPDGVSAKDPADVASARPGILKQLAAEAVPAMRYYFQRFKIGSDGEGVKKNMRSLLSKIRLIASPVERAQWFREASRLSGIQENFLIEEMDALKAPPVPSAPSNPPHSAASVLSRKEMISQQIVALILNFQRLYPVFQPSIGDLPESYRLVLQAALREQNAVLTADQKDLMNIVSLRSGLETLDENRAEAELSELRRQLRLENLREKRQKNSFAIQQAEQRGEDIGALLAEKQSIADELRRLEVKGVKVI